MANAKVVILGGGFGGLNAAKALGNSRFDVWLIDKTNHHLFQPLLYQVASAALSPGDIAVPIREILSPYENVTVLMGEVAAVDKDKRHAVLQNGDRIAYDHLIVALGARHSYFGNDAFISDGFFDIPTPQLSTWPDRYYHSSQDTPDQMSDNTLGRMGAAPGARTSLS